LPLLSSALGPRPLRRLRENPHGLLATRERPGDFLERRIKTRSGKVELFPRDVYARLDELASTLDLHQGEGATPVLRLFTKRERLGHNSWMHSNKALHTPEQRVHVSRQDAERLSLRDGERVRLSSATGSIELPVSISEDIVTGAVAVSHGYGHELSSSWQAARERGGQNVNLLAASGPLAVDPLTGMCKFVGVPVTLSRACEKDAGLAEGHTSQGSVSRASNLPFKL
jgi:anaerobic selenocysteine-containing dehydrogenase